MNASYSFVGSSVIDAIVFGKNQGTIDMKKLDLLNALAESHRFIAAGEATLVRFKDEFNDTELLYTKETAATKRASMDLTRALAELRKSSG